MHIHKDRVQTAMQNPIFTQSRLELDSSFEVLTFTNHMKSDFCKPDRNHFWEVVSNRIWTDAFQSERLQTLRSVLTVRDVTRNAIPSSDHPPVSSCGAISTEWRDRRQKHQSLDRGWNEMPLCCCCCRNYMTSHNTHAGQSRCYSNLSDRSVMWTSLKRDKSNLDTCWKQCGQSALKIGFEKESDFACSLNTAKVIYYSRFS